MPGLPRQERQYINNILAYIETKHCGTETAIMLDLQGNVSEGYASNIFAVDGSTVVTPPLGNVLAGITRDVIIELCRSLSIPIQKRPLTLYDLVTGSEAFESSTLGEIVPIASIDGQTIGSSSPGPVTSRLHRELRKLIDSGMQVDMSATLPAEEMVASGAAPTITSGFRSIHPEQAVSGYAQGLSQAQIFVFALLPQAARISLPPLTSPFIEVVKNSAVVMFVGVQELTFETQEISQATLRSFEVATVATVLYVIVTLLVVGGMNNVSRSLRWVVWQAAPFLLRGLAVSWGLAIAAVLIGLVTGILLAAARLYGFIAIRQAATAYIELVRSIPQIMTIFWIYFSVPRLTGVALDAWPAVVMALSLIASAYLAEVVRAGLMSIPKVHRQSAYTAGVRATDSLLHIVLPQALRNMLPALIAHIVMIFKVTSLVYLIGLVDFFRATMLVNNRDYAPYALYLAMALVYLCCNFLLSALIRWFDPRFALVT